MRRSQRLSGASSLRQASATACACACASCCGGGDQQALPPLLAALPLRRAAAAPHLGNVGGLGAVLGRGLLRLRQVLGSRLLVGLHVQGGRLLRVGGGREQRQQQRGGEDPPARAPRGWQVEAGADLPRGAARCPRVDARPRIGAAAASWRVPPLPIAPGSLLGRAPARQRPAAARPRPRGDEDAFCWRCWRAPVF